MQGLRIVLLSIALAVLYGLVHDQVTIRICLEYFTIGHPPLVASTSPTVIALAWGVAATWWMGLILGLILWPVMRAGSRPKLTWHGLVRPGVMLLVVMAVFAVAAGVTGHRLALDGKVRLVGPWADQVPLEQHVPYLTALWAHNASYLVGVLGGLVVAIILWRRRGRLAREAAGRLTGLGLLLAATCALTGCLDERTKVRLASTGKGTLARNVTLVRAERDDLLRRLAGFYGAAEAPDVLPFADPFHPRWIRARARAHRGVALERVERTEEKGCRTTAIAASFESLEAAARADLFFPATVRLERLAPEEGDGPRWRLTLRDPWYDAARTEDGVLGGRPFREVFDAALPALDSMIRTFEIRLPTPVVSTNGTLDPSKRRVTWRTTTVDIATKRGLHRVVVFEDAEGLQLAPFRHRPDLDALMERALEAPPGVTASPPKPPAQDAPR